MSASPDDFRAALGRFATGVTILTTRDAAGTDHGMTVSAFSSVSLEPPLILACIARTADMHPVLSKATDFALNILADDQESVSRRFADDIEGRFDGLSLTRAASGVVLLSGAHAHIECKRVAWHDAGDHSICIGEVSCVALGVGRPLLYYRGGYSRLER